MGKRQFREQLAHERELRHVTDRLTRRATRLQAKEYARRLTELNGEAGRIRDILANTVPREKFEDYKADHSRQVDGLVSATDAKVEAAARELEAKLNAISDRVTTNTRSLQRLEGAVSLVRFLGVGGLVGLAIGLYSIFGPH